MSSRCISDEDGQRLRGECDSGYSDEHGHPSSHASPPSGRRSLRLPSRNRVTLSYEPSRRARPWCPIRAHTPRNTGQEGNPLGRPRTARDPAPLANSCHFARTPATTTPYFSRNEGVPGSSPGVGFSLASAGNGVGRSVDSPETAEDTRLEQRKVSHWGACIVAAAKSCRSGRFRHSILVPSGSLLTEGVCSRARRASSAPLDAGGGPAGYEAHDSRPPKGGHSRPP